MFFVFDPSAFTKISALRDRLGRMDDAALERFGRAAAYKASPAAYPAGQSPLETFRIQLVEARAEWTRRHSGGEPLVSR
jgi:hypothetical protein